MHEAAFRALGLDAEYRLVRVPADRPELVGPRMRDLAATGGGNVTLPHKETAATALDLPAEDVRLSGACNCFWSDASGLLCGDNTDVSGIVRTLEDLIGVDSPAGSALVLGAGGAARAAAIACLRAGWERVAIRNRDPDRAERLVRGLSDAAGRRLPLEVDPAGAPAGAPDLVVQATRLGLSASDPLPLSLEGLAPRFVLDLVYAPGGTPWLRLARSAGVRAAGGAQVLVHQGALSLERWLGRAPGPDVVGAMRAAIRPAAE